MHTGGGGGGHWGDNKVIYYVDIYNSFILEAQVLAYSNPTHLASTFDGNCCDRSNIITLPLTCTAMCNNSFTFCFREAGRRDMDSTEDDGSNCPYG